MQNQPEYEMKIVVLGRSATGKTSLVRAFKNEEFQRQLPSTVGCDLVKIRKNIDDKNMMLCFWDTAGQQRFKSITKCFYARADAIIYVFSVVDLDSIDSLAYWVKEVRETLIDDNLIEIFLANKSDLLDEIDANWEEQAFEKISKLYEDSDKKSSVKYRETTDNSQYDDVEILEVSALTRYGINKSLDLLSKKLANKIEKEKEQGVAHTVKCESKLSIHMDTKKREGVCGCL